MMRRVVLLACGMVACLNLARGAEVDDEYLWLEEVEGERALDWVRARNRDSLARFEADPRYAEFKDVAERILQDKERIPYGSLRKGYVYNFWRDEDHIRGVWRRAPLEGYLKEDVPWEILLDVDALAEEQEENWVFKGVTNLPPDYRRCLVRLSRGGKDASVIREFDVQERAFVADGFVLPEAKSWVEWLDRDTLVVGTDFGEGSLTESGYPRILKIWRRGQPLEEAETLFEGELDDVHVWFSREVRPDGAVALVGRDITFYTTEYRLFAPDGSLKRLPVPLDANLSGYFDGRLLFQLRSDWDVRTVHGRNGPVLKGALVAIEVEELMRGEADGPRVEVLYVPDERSSILEVGPTSERVLVSVLSNVQGKVLAFRREATDAGPRWQSQQISMPGHGNVGIVSNNAFTDQAFLSYENFLVPEQLSFLEEGSNDPEVVKTLKPKFDAEGLVVEQKETASKDGTLIPYFIVHREDLEPDGDNPTLLYAYGGFEIPMLPQYMALSGKLWIEQGGVFALANIRGGGEFGPRWHQAALKENRQRAFDDFLAVAEDLVRRKITSPRRLGIMGGSNGGLLMGAAFTQRPDLFGAVVCLVPLLDMLRYTELLAGPSWAAEYGDPDDEAMRAVLAGYSPYHNLRPDVRYPEVFFITSTKDDRVHPGHARKMVARMLGMGSKVFYYENIEGGHSAGANLRQHARRYALQYVYLHRKLFEDGQRASGGR